MKINKLFNKSILMLVLFLTMTTSLIYILDYVENKNNLLFDFSFNNYSKLNTNSINALKSIVDKTNIYILNTNTDKQLESLLKNYTKTNSNIKFEKINIAHNPQLSYQFANDGKNSLRKDSIIIYSETNKKFIILNPENMLSYGFDIDKKAYKIDGIKYEQEITKALLYVNAKQNKTVCFLTGHGEKNKEYLQSLINYLNINAYDVKIINKLDANLDKESILMIFAPQSDLSNDEIKIIKQFEENSGSIIFAVNNSNSISKLQNIQALLTSYGVRIKKGNIIADEKDKQSYYKDPSNILPYMQSGSKLDLLINNNKDILLMPSPCAFEIDKKIAYNCEPLLKTSKTSKLINDDSKIIDEGEFLLSVYSEKLNSNSHISRFIALGNTDVICNSYLSTITFSNEFTQTLLNILQPEKAINIDIAVKPAFRKQMLPISKTVGICLIIVIPLFVLLLGISVIIKRKSL